MVNKHRPTNNSLKYKLTKLLKSEMLSLNIEQDSTVYCYTLNIKPQAY